MLIEDGTHILVNRPGVIGLVQAVDELGLWFMTADLVCSWATLYCRLLLELLRLLKPVLLWVLRVLLVRLVLMLLMMYLGTQAFRALLL